MYVSTLFSKTFLTFFKNYLAHHFARAHTLDDAFHDGKSEALTTRKIFRQRIMLLHERFEHLFDEILTDADTGT